MDSYLYRQKMVFAPNITLDRNLLKEYDWLRDDNPTMVYRYNFTPTGFSDSFEILNQKPFDTPWAYNCREVIAIKRAAGKDDHWRYDHPSHPAIVTWTQAHIPNFKSPILRNDGMMDARGGFSQYFRRTYGGLDDNNCPIVLDHFEHLVDETPNRLFIEWSDMRYTEVLSPFDSNDSTDSDTSRTASPSPDPVSPLDSYAPRMPVPVGDNQGQYDIAAPLNLASPAYLTPEPPSTPINNCLRVVNPRFSDDLVLLGTVRDVCDACGQESTSPGQELAWYDERGVSYPMELA
jgi:hypothetical protein